MRWFKTRSGERINLERIDKIESTHVQEFGSNYFEYYACVQNQRYPICEVHIPPCAIFAPDEFLEKNIMDIIKRVKDGETIDFKKAFPRVVFCDEKNP